MGTQTPGNYFLMFILNGWGYSKGQFGEEHTFIPCYVTHDWSKSEGSMGHNPHFMYCERYNNPHFWLLSTEQNVRAWYKL